MNLTQSYVGNYDKGDVFLTCATLKSIDMEYLMTSKCGKLRLHFLITLNITGSAPSLTTCWQQTSDRRVTTSEIQTITTVNGTILIKFQPSVQSGCYMQLSSFGSALIRRTVGREKSRYSQSDTKQKSIESFFELTRLKFTPFSDILFRYHLASCHVFVLLWLGFKIVIIFFSRNSPRLPSAPTILLMFLHCNRKSRADLVRLQSFIDSVAAAFADLIRLRAFLTLTDDTPRRTR